MIKVGIVGGTGYTGVELLRLLALHPDVELTAITSRQEAGKSVADLFPSLRHRVDLVYSDLDHARLSTCDLVFFATPNGTAMTRVPDLLEAGAKVVDLSADFRLRDVEEWEMWYQMKHVCADLLGEAVYGLPEINREQIRNSRLVANPGCYPTATLLALLPLVEKKWVDVDRLIVDAKSGVSGAGRQAKVDHLYCEVAESFKAYSAAGHRHLPEIRQALIAVSGMPVNLTFVPHLTPMIRGIHATCYASLLRTDLSDDDIHRAYRERYLEEPFVDVLDWGQHPETRSVRGSNDCRIGVHRPQNGQVVVVLSVIDNLVKGAAGQAIQNMNLMFGLSENAGLDIAPLSP